MRVVAIHRIIRAGVGGLLVVTFAGGLRAQEALADRVIVTAERTTTTPDESGFAEMELDRATLDQSPALRLDDVLRDQVPGFSLFRRSSSRVANPTNQGVSLRNIGPNGAGRTLVLLDGIPQNDPFGGWVYWSRLPPNSLDSIRIVEGGGAGVFGDAALGGTIELRSRRGVGDSYSVEAEGGSDGTYEGTLAGQRAVAGGTVTVFGRADRFSTDGYPVVRGSQRGPVDIQASSEENLLDGGISWNFTPTNTLTVRASGFQEDRGNGTPRTNNHSEAGDFNASLDGELPGTRLDYQLLVYGQVREFRSFFSSVNASRTVETPSLDQYSVPAQSVGGSATVSLPVGSQHQLLVGADARWVSGESEEHFRFVNGGFTRNRDAGGAQVFAGAFADDTWRPAPGTTLSASGRVDYYNNYDGSRRETDLATGAATLDERFVSQDGFVANGRLGASQKLWGDLLRLRAAGYTGFRVPTLNEFYRPYRVGNDIIEANAGLRPERLYGAELGVDSQPVRSVRLSLGGYYNELDHPVANVTVATGPGTVAPFGFIPAGGTGEIRENLGRAGIYGVEAEATWTPVSAWQLSVQYLYSHGVVESALTQPADEGKRLAQAPEHQGIVGVHWTPWKPLRATIQTRLVGDQFEDDRNTLRLDPYASVDVQVSLQAMAHLQTWVSVENLFDTEIQTGKNAAGLISTGSPRLINGGMRWNY